MYSIAARPTTRQYNFKYNNCGILQTEVSKIKMINQRKYYNYVKLICDLVIQPVSEESSKRQVNYILMSTKLQWSCQVNWAAAAATSSSRRKVSGTYQGRLISLLQQWSC
jgi:hypothetical protein